MLYTIIVRNYHTINGVSNIPAMSEIQNYCSSVESWWSFSQLDKKHDIIFCRSRGYYFFFILSSSHFRILVHFQFSLKSSSNFKSIPLIYPIFKTILQSLSIETTFCPILEIFKSIQLISKNFIFKN
jgi:hypothetical protein